MLADIGNHGFIRSRAVTTASRVSKGGVAAVASPEPLDQYRRLIESLTNCAIFGLSTDGKIASWNTGASQTFGYEEGEVLGKDYSLIFTEEDIAKGRPKAELAEALEVGKSSVDGWHIRKDRSRFWCSDTVQPVRDEGGAVIGFTKIIQDANERHVSTERLRESEESLRLLIESVTEYAIFSIDPDGKIMSWNPGAEHIFGYRADEVTGKHFSLLYPHEALARGVAETEIMTAARDGHAIDEGWHVRRNGDAFYATGQMTRLRPDAAGGARGFVKIAHDITLRNEAEKKIERQAFHDELTQLPNRAYFIDCLRRSIARAKRHPQDRFAVIFLDLDRFKLVNDSLGHVLADALLVHVARSLEKCVRPEDVVARMGGDEFTILIADIHDPSDAVGLAERIHRALHRPFLLKGLEVVTTASMGIAIGSASLDQADDILRDADTAMYVAKDRGRSRHVVFDSGMRGRAVDLLKLQMDLRRAVERREFFIDYQPIVSLQNRKAIGFEALVRWNHPERGVLSPASFIGEAENIGAIIQIDRWVLRAACRQIKAWQVTCGDESLTVSVNLSSKQFGQENLLVEIRDALEQSNLSPSSLKLEITETVLMEHFEFTEATVARIGELGVELYIDDFGTGYSSLSYLARLPLTLLKVDRSFVSQNLSNPRNIVIGQTIVALAHNLGLKALAEGIETKQQFATLRDAGCDFGQGNWFSKPVHADVAGTLVGAMLPRSD